MKFWHLIVALTALFQNVLSAEDPTLATTAREWISSSGEHKTKGRLVGFISAGVRLELENGTSREVLLDKLSKEDREYARREFRLWEGRPSLGVTFTDLVRVRAAWMADEDYKKDAEFRAMVKAHPSQPALWVSEIEALSAFRGGDLSKGDIVTHVAGAQVRDFDSLMDALMGVKAGEECEVKILRRELKPKGIVFKPATISALPVRHAKRLALLAGASEVAAKELAKSGPLRIENGGMSENVIGIPVVTITVKNAAKSSCVAFTVEIECFDNFDEKVSDLRGSNVFRGISQEEIRAGMSKEGGWTLNLHANTTRATVRIVRTKLSDGSEWNAKDGMPPEVSVRLKK